MRRLLRAVAAACVVLLASGCATEVISGHAFSDDVAQYTYMKNEYRSYSQDLEADLTGSTPFSSGANANVSGHFYQYAVWGEHTLSTESTVLAMGNPPAIAVLQSSSNAGDTLDRFHPAGSEWDYFLLGESYADLAPTSWVRIPTRLGDPERYEDMCDLVGYTVVCALREAVAKTDTRLGDKAHKTVRVSDDGTVQLYAQATLQQIMDTKTLFNLTSDLEKELTDQMRSSLLTVITWLSPDGSLSKIEVAGQVPGGDSPLKLQIGYEITGDVSADDFPAPPSSFDVTEYTGAKADEFLTGLANR